MSALPTFEIRGRYAHLLPLRQEHARALFEVASRSRATYGLTLVPDTLKGMEAHVARALEHHASRSALPFAVLDAKTGHVAGTTRFMNIEYWDYPDGHALGRSREIPHVVEIGSTWLGESYQRSGINTEAKLGLLTHAFETWKVLRVSLKTDSRNARSRANIERVGAHFDGILRAHMPSFDGGIRDTAFYSILLGEWPAVKMALQARLK